MNKLFQSTVLAAAIFIAGTLSTSAQQFSINGQLVGPIVATVAGMDSQQGVPVRSEPSLSGRVLGYLTPGTRVQNYPEFVNGWVRIQEPMNGAWIEVSNLKQIGGTGIVVAVDKPEMCLRVRSGPGTTYPIVGCVSSGRTVNLTGLWSANNWAEIETPVRGWVAAWQIKTNLAPSTVASTVPTRRTVYKYTSPTTITYIEPYPVRRYYYYGYPRYGYWSYRHYWRHYPRSYYYSGYYYKSPGVAVRVGPGGVGVRAGGVGVRVGPGGVGVRVR